MIKPTSNSASKKLSRRAFVMMSASSFLAACQIPPPRTSDATSTPAAIVLQAATPTPTSDATPAPPVQPCSMGVFRETFYYGLDSVMEEYLPGCDTEITEPSQLESGQMAELAMAGTVPDLYIGFRFNPLVLRDFLLPVSEFVDLLISEHGALNPHYARQIYYQGEAYAVPFHAWGEGGWARNDLFADNMGIALEDVRTYEELRESCLTLSASLGIPAWGMSVGPTWGGYLVARVLNGYGAMWAGEDGMEVTIASEEAVEAVAWLAETYTNENFVPMLPPDVLQRNNAELVNLFVEGNLAYTQSGSSLYRRLRAERPEIAEVTTYHVPVGGPSLQEFNGLPTSLFLIFKDSQNPEIIQELLADLLANAVEPLIAANSPEVLPAYANMWETPAVEEDAYILAQKPTALDENGWNGLAWPAPTTPLMQAVMDNFVHTEMVSAVISGELGPEEAVMLAQERSEELAAQVGN